MPRTLINFSSSSPGLSPSRLFIALNFVAEYHDEKALDPTLLTKLQALTPRLMHWDARTWLLDLSPCLSFWSGIAARKKVGVWNLWQELLEQRFGKKLQASAAIHPWQALTLLAYVRERKLYGLYYGESPFGRQLLRELSWQAWHAPSDALLLHINAAGGKRADAARFRSQWAQLQRAMARLGCERPAALSQATASAMARRFGALLGTMWRWSFGEENAAATAGFSCDFPWQGFFPAERVGVERHLDEALSLWEHMQGLLCADLDKLCQVSSLDEQQRISCLSWKLVFDSMDERDLEIRFKHPHALSNERGSHPTALCQARHQLEAMTSALEQFQTPTICSWRLEIREKMVLSPAFIGLFTDSDDSADSDQQQTKIWALENKLPLLFFHYQLRASFIPQDDFIGADTLAPAFDLAPWSLAALHRPLFVYKIATKAQFHQFQTPTFSERTANKWWVSGNSWGSGIVDDYFIAVEGGKQAYWLCRGQGGEWMCRGIFD
jgi:hypothetical protein